jgi:GTP-dependent phosphoenolpyruvate carboxykinase
MRQDGGICIAHRLPIRDAIEHKDQNVRSALADYMANIMTAMMSDGNVYACFVCDEPWSKHCAPHQFLMIEITDSAYAFASAICGDCCGRPDTIIAALDDYFDAEFMLMPEAGHA